MEDKSAGALADGLFGRQTASGMPSRSRAGIEARRRAMGHVMNMLFYLQSLKSIRDSVPPDHRDSFDLQYGAREKDPAVSLVLSLTLGSFGIDRFYIGNVILGILKLITFGGAFIWTIIDWFLIMGATRRANIAIATQVKQMIAS
jgi:TM2 domain-containing membrane protein YozV